MTEYEQLQHIEMWRERALRAESRNDQLRASLATVTAERDGLRHNWHQAVQDGTAIAEDLATERAAHESLKTVLADVQDSREALYVTLESTRAAHEETKRSLAEIHKLTGRGEGHGSVKSTTACVVDAVLSMRTDAAETDRDLEIARAALAKAEARVKRVEALRDVHAKQTDNSVFSTALVEYINEALRG